MKHFLKWKLILPLLTLFFTAGAIFGLMAGNGIGVHAAAGNITTQDQALAKSILSNPNIVLAKSHLGGKTDHIYCTGKIDHATPYCNIIELANGQKAARSSYYDPTVGQSGPGGSTTVQPLILQIILAAASGHQVGVFEIAGGVHGTHTAHYTGHAVDFNMFNGQQLTGRNQPSLDLIQAILSLLPAGSAIGQSQCGPLPSSLAKELQARNIQIIIDSCGQVYVQIP